MLLLEMVGLKTDPGGTGVMRAAEEEEEEEEEKGTGGVLGFTKVQLRVKGFVGRGTAEEGTGTGTAGELGMRAFSEEVIVTVFQRLRRLRQWAISLLVTTVGSTGFEEEEEPDRIGMLRPPALWCKVSIGSVGGGVGVEIVLVVVVVVGVSAD